MWYILIGLTAGWVKSLVVQCDTRELIINLLVGVMGSILGGRLCYIMIDPFAAACFASLITATLGAILLLLIVHLFLK